VAWKGRPGRNLVKIDASVATALLKERERRLFPNRDLGSTIHCVIWLKSRKSEASCRAVGESGNVELCSPQTRERHPNHRTACIAREG
jgi:hypothetical protein